MRTLLIADDVKMNRMILKEMFKDSYRILEAENGLEAIEQLKKDNTIVMVLLDIKMPKADGFFVLEQMRNMQLIQHIPVILITGADSVEYKRKGYQLGVTDFLSKPFDDIIVRQRVANTVSLYEHKNNTEKLAKKLADKIQKVNDEIIEGFSGLVELRNKESKWHIIRVKGFTKILLQSMAKLHPGIFTEEYVDLLVKAAAVHDIGKIRIPDNILNKPKSEGRLTHDEFEVMKLHAQYGCEILNTYFKQLIDDDYNFYNLCMQICRSHHERWNGQGYPDGLKNDQIPLSAQVVSVADVYDALVSERCYKDAFSHSVAVKMIMNGECGVFNPEIMQCFAESESKFKAFSETTKGQE
jgi:putative two-component system response regulator